MDRLLDRARQEQEWGVPAILEACLTMAETDPAQGARLAAFIKDRPAPPIPPNIVPKISDQPWALGIFQAWEKGDVDRKSVVSVKSVSVRVDLGGRRHINTKQTDTKNKYVT